MYPLLQGYDSVAMDVDLELGGTDQTFNMMMGRHLQRIYNNKEKWVLSTPIINGTDGRKMSKTYNNFVSLTEDPLNMYGKLMRVADEMIVEYFTLLTDIDSSEIESMAKAMKSGDNPMTFKKQLAFTITEQYHSKAEAQRAAKHFEQTVQNKEVSVNSPEVNRASFIDVPAYKSVAGTASISNSEARRLMVQMAVKTLPELKVITNPNEPILLSNATTAIKIGKKIFKLKK